MTVTIKLRDQDKPLKFTSVYKITNSEGQINLWFDGEWNTPRSWDKVRIEFPVLVDL